MNLVTKQEAARELLARHLARTHLLDFMRYCWWMPGPLIVGRHMSAICTAIDAAIDDDRRKALDKVLQACGGIAEMQQMQDEAGKPAARDDDEL
jgi:hypothetical protein